MLHSAGSSKKKKVASTPRNAGRPLEKDSVGRTAILEAAIVLLRGKTPEELTLVDVAALAKVDRALIRYYFTDKAGLLKAVAINVMDELQGRSQAMLLQEGSLEEKIRKRFELLIGIMHEIPQFTQLVFKEIYYAENAQEAHGDAPLASQHIVGRGLVLTKALIDSVEVDAIGHEMDPRFLHLMILGSSIFFATSQPLLQVMFGEGFDRKELTDRYIDFATKVLLRGLGASSRGR